MSALIHLVLLSCLAAVFIQARPDQENGYVEHSYDMIQRKLDDVLFELQSRGKNPKPDKDSQEGGSGKDSQGKDSQEGGSGKDSEEGSDENDSGKGVKGKDLKNVAKMCGVDEKDLKKLMKGEGYMIERSENGTVSTTTTSNTATTSTLTNTATTSKPTNTTTTMTPGTATTTQAMDPTMIKLIDCAVELQTTVLDSLTKVDLDKLKSKSMLSFLKSLSEMKKVTKQAEEVAKEERIRSLTEKLMELLE